MELLKLAEDYGKLRNHSVVTRQSFIYFAKAMGNPRLSNVTTLWLQQLAANTRSASTWNQHLGRLRALARYAVMRGAADMSHPVFTAKRKLAQLPERGILSDQAVQAVRNAVAHMGDRGEYYSQGWFWHTVLDVLYYTGVRRKQLCHILWDDIDLRAGTIYLRPEGSKTEFGAVLPMHLNLVDVLRHYKAMLYVHTGQSPKPGQPLFVPAHVNSSGDRVLTPQRVSAFFLAISRRVGFKVSAHRFRHGFATRLSRQARSLQDLQAVQSLMTHVRIETTLGYFHPSYDDKLALLDIPVRGIVP